MDIRFKGACRNRTNDLSYPKGESYPKGRSQATLTTRPKPRLNLHTLRLGRPNAFCAIRESNPNLPLGRQ